MHSELFSPNAQQPTRTGRNEDEHIGPNGKRKHRTTTRKPPNTETPHQPSARATPQSKAEDKRLQSLANYYAFYIVPATKEETRFRHGHWEEKRSKVKQALHSVCTAAKKMEAFTECGSQCTVEWSPTLQKHRTRANHCKCRHCEPCQRSRANRLSANLKTRLGTQPEGRFRFVTLTLRHSQTPLAAQIKRLYASFRKLRTTKVWKKTQVGGAFILEVKYNRKTREWHPHLHIITEGAWMRQSDLAAVWKKITTDSHVVDIRALKTTADAAHYLAKYVSKGTSDAVWDDHDAAQEWILATKGVRACATYGRWRGFKLMEMTERATDWAAVGTLTNIIHAAGRGEPWAQAILLSLRPPGRTPEVGKRATPPPPSS